MSKTHSSVIKWPKMNLSIRKRRRKGRTTPTIAQSIELTMILLVLFHVALDDGSGVTKRRQLVMRVNCIENNNKQQQRVESSSPNHHHPHQIQYMSLSAPYDTIPVASEPDQMTAEHATPFESMITEAQTTNEYEQQQQQQPSDEQDQQQQQQQQLNEQLNQQDNNLQQQQQEATNENEQLEMGEQQEQQLANALAAGGDDSSNNSNNYNNENNSVEQQVDGGTSHSFGDGSTAAGAVESAAADHQAAQNQDEQNQAQLMLEQQQQDTGPQLHHHNQLNSSAEAAAVAAATASLTGTELAASGPKLPTQYESVLMIPPEGYYDDYFKPISSTQNLFAANPTGGAGALQLDDSSSSSSITKNQAENMLPVSPSSITSSNSNNNMIWPQSQSSAETDDYRMTTESAMMMNPGGGDPLIDTAQNSHMPVESPPATPASSHQSGMWPPPPPPGDMADENEALMERPPSPLPHRPGMMGGRGAETNGSMSGEILFHRQQQQRNSLMRETQPMPVDEPPPSSSIEKQRPGGGNNNSNLRPPQPARPQLPPMQPPPPPPAPLQRPHLAPAVSHNTFDELSGGVQLIMANTTHDPTKNEKVINYLSEGHQDLRRNQAPGQSVRDTFVNKDMNEYPPPTPAPQVAPSNNNNNNNNINPLQRTQHQHQQQQPYNSNEQRRFQHQQQHQHTTACRSSGHHSQQQPAQPQATHMQQQVTQVHFNPSDLILSPPTAAPSTRESGSTLENLVKLPAKVKKIRETNPDKNELMNELLTALDRVKVAIYKLQPLTAKMNAIYRKSVTSNTRDIIMDNHKGTYAKRYPPGDYDDSYDKIHPSELFSARQEQELKKRNTRSSSSSRTKQQQQQQSQNNKNKKQNSSSVNRHLNRGSSGAFRRSESVATPVYLPAPKEILEKYANSSGGNGDSLRLVGGDDEKIRNRNNLTSSSARTMISAVDDEQDASTVKRISLMTESDQSLLGLAGSGFGRRLGIGPALSSSVSSLSPSRATPQDNHQMLNNNNKTFFPSSNSSSDNAPFATFHVNNSATALDGNEKNVSIENDSGGSEDDDSYSRRPGFANRFLRVSSMTGDGDEEMQESSSSAASFEGADGEDQEQRRPLFGYRITIYQTPSTADSSMSSSEGEGEMASSQSGSASGDDGEGVQGFKEQFSYEIDGLTGTIQRLKVDENEIGGVAAPAGGGEALIDERGEHDLTKGASADNMTFSSSPTNRTLITLVNNTKVASAHVDNDSDMMLTSESSISEQEQQQAREEDEARDLKSSASSGSSKSKKDGGEKTGKKSAEEKSSGEKEEGKKRGEASKKGASKKKKAEEEKRKKKEYKKIKHNKGVISKEKKTMHRDKHIKAHDRGAAKEKALKERTQIEFFEREQIVDDEFEKGKKSTTKAKWELGHNSKKTIKDNVSANEGGSDPKQHQHHSGASDPMSSAGSNEHEHLVAQESKNGEKNHESEKGIALGASSDKKSHKFEKKNMSAKGKKFKGWREKGYKIITETEFIDRGSLHDSAYKKRDKGAAHHQKYKKHHSSSEGHHGSMHETHKKSNKKEEKKYKQQEKKSSQSKKSEHEKEKKENSKGAREKGASEKKSTHHHQHHKDHGDKFASASNEEPNTTSTGDYNIDERADINNNNNNDNGSDSHDELDEGMETKGLGSREPHRATTDGQAIGRNNASGPPQMDSKALRAKTTMRISSPPESKSSHNNTHQTVTTPRMFASAGSNYIVKPGAMLSQERNSQALQHVSSSTSVSPTIEVMVNNKTLSRFLISSDDIGPINQEKDQSPSEYSGSNTLPRLLQTTSSSNSSTNINHHNLNNNHVVQNHRHQHHHPNVSVFNLTETGEVDQNQRQQGGELKTSSTRKHQTQAVAHNHLMSPYSNVRLNNTHTSIPTLNNHHKHHQNAVQTSMRPTNDRSNQNSAGFEKGGNITISNNNGTTILDIIDNMTGRHLNKTKIGTYEFELDHHNQNNSQTKLLLPRAINNNNTNINTSQQQLLHRPLVTSTTTAIPHSHQTTSSYSSSNKFNSSTIGNFTTDRISATTTTTAIPIRSTVSTIHPSASVRTNESAGKQRRDYGGNFDQQHTSYHHERMNDNLETDLGEKLLMNLLHRTQQPQSNTQTRQQQRRDIKNNSEVIRLASNNQNNTHTGQLGDQNKLLNSRLNESHFKVNEFVTTKHTPTTKINSIESKLPSQLNNYFTQDQTDAAAQFLRFIQNANHLQQQHNLPQLPALAALLANQPITSQSSSIIDNPPLPSASEFYTNNQHQLSFMQPNQAPSHHHINHNNNHHNQQQQQSYLRHQDQMLDARLQSPSTLNALFTPLGANQLSRTTMFNRAVEPPPFSADYDQSTLASAISSTNFLTDKPF